MNDQDAEKERTRAMTKKIHITRVTTAIAAVAAFSTTVSAKAAHTVTVAQLEARTTFKDLEALASAAAKEADLLLSFTQILGIDHAAHRLSLLELKRDINGVRPDTARGGHNVFCRRTALSRESILGKTGEVRCGEVICRGLFLE
jgi:hypothetical protein